MSKYNLNEKVGDDFFEFDLDGFVYKMTYPSSADLIDLNQTISDTDDNLTKLSELRKNNGDPKKIAAIEQKLESINISFLDWCMKYIAANDEKAPALKETLLNKNVKYLLAFMDIVKSEFND